MTGTTIPYVGTELALFEAAANWKRYWASQIAPYIGRRVGEVGAGMGANTAVLATQASEWLCVEPDPALARSIEARKNRCELPPSCEVLVGTISDLPATRRFDTILYLDVLEHIADDRAELATAGARLSSGGYLVVLSPAHQWLFSAFDAAIGHYRRYSSRTLIDLSPPELLLRVVRYLDSGGMIASLGNRWVSRASQPTALQIAFWDKVLVPISRLADPLAGYQVGKSILAVWQRP